MSQKRAAWEKSSSGRPEFDRGSRSAGLIVELGVVLSRTTGGGGPAVYAAICLGTEGGRRRIRDSLTLVIDAVTRRRS